MKKFFLAVLTSLLVTGAWAQDGTMMKSDKTAPADGSMMKSDTTAPAAGTMMRASPSAFADPLDASAYNIKPFGKQVVAFTTEAAAQTLAKSQTVVYYFAATWCPDCQATYRDFQANFSKIPANLTVVFVNYDKSSDLKKKYGITAQHTFVVVGPAGEKKKVWSGAATVADIVKNSLAM